MKFIFYFYYSAFCPFLSKLMCVWDSEEGRLSGEKETDDLRFGGVIDSI